ncbi:MAG: hypothetical protein ACYDC1_07715 [Limisphaerales bacterium]
MKGRAANPIALASIVLLAGFVPGLAPLHGGSRELYRMAPEGHARNRDLAAKAHEVNLQRQATNPDLLVLPGVVADRNSRRVEVLVERTRLGPESPCEFTVVAETSDHGYEALLMALAKPGDVHRAIQFLGLEPGKPFDPRAHRFWPRGERFTLSVAGADGRRLRLEQLLVDRRTGQTLREEGFVFTGSLTVPARHDPQAQVYAADEYQPKSIVSLFNSAHSVLQVPYLAAKGEVYQNTIVNPERPLPEGVLLSLLIEPASPDGSPRVKDLELRVRSVIPPADASLTGLARLNFLDLELRDQEAVLNARPTLLAVLEALARLDRKNQDCFLTVSIADEVELGDAQGLARILSTIDAEKGVRIEPPPPGQLYYRAFTPDPGLLDRKNRIHHPWELSLSNHRGPVEGTLRRIDSVWGEGGSVPELEATEFPIAGPEDLRQTLDAEAERARKTGNRPRPPVMLVFAASTLRYGEMTRILAPALPAHPAVHVYLDTTLPPLPTTHRTPTKTP